MGLFAIIFRIYCDQVYASVVGASRIFCAAKVDVVVVREGCEIESAEFHGCRLGLMPRSSVSVVEDDEVRKVVEVVDDECKVSHGFSALVAGNCEAGHGVWVVKDIAVDLPAGACQ